METFLGGKVTLHCGDNREVIRSMADNSIDSIVTDPPYALVSIVKRFSKEDPEDVENNFVKRKTDGQGVSPYQRAARGFMGKSWDTGESAHAVEFWQECLRVLKPGGHVVAFAGTRTYHRMAVAIEDAGFEIRDMISWIYGSGFPKSHDVSKGIDRMNGHWRGRDSSPPVQTSVAKGMEYDRVDKGEPITPDAVEWDGWGTALKPALEPICLARKPLIGTVADNVLQHGTGAINVDGCRVECGDDLGRDNGGTDKLSWGGTYGSGSNAASQRKAQGLAPQGRWPANIVHDGSEEVLAAFPETSSGAMARSVDGYNGDSVTGFLRGRSGPDNQHGDSGSAARFFYTAKADATDRIGSKHPTVKPIDLMQWLVRLVTPKGGMVLDPFAGTGTTAEACFREGARCLLIERETEYQADIRRRMALVMAGPDERARESIKAKMNGLPPDYGPLFGGLDTDERGGAGRSTESSRTNDWTDGTEVVTDSPI